eukprot:scpid86823/ scgid28999/ 
MEAQPKIVAKSAAELKDGDHVFVRRFKWQRKTANADGTVRYRYSHHGIYDAVNKKVIQFGRPSKERPQKRDVTPLFLPGGVRRRAREVVMKGLGGFSSLFSSQIIHHDLGTFMQYRDKKVLVYSYLGETPNQEHPAEDPYGIDGISPDYERNKSVELRGQDAPRSHAADIARWLLKNQPHLFSSYHIFKSNCEHFATLCKTCRIDTMEELVEICKTESVNGIMKMNDWTKYSLCRSLQSERYMRGARGLRSVTGNDKWITDAGDEAAKAATSDEQAVAEFTACRDDEEAALIRRCEAEDCEIEECGLEDEDDS